MSYILKKYIFWQLYEQGPEQEDPRRSYSVSSGKSWQYWTRARMAGRHQFPVTLSLEVEPARLADGLVGLK